MPARLEHVNFTVTNPEATADWMEEAFGWHVRWQGPAINGGRTVHVGTDDAYVALFAPADPLQPKVQSYNVIGGLNHVAVVVDDIDAAERAVKQAGFEPHSHADYEPGLRFYFHDADNIEYEVVQYD